MFRSLLLLPLSAANIIKALLSSPKYEIRNQSIFCKHILNHISYIFTNKVLKGPKGKMKIKFSYYVFEISIVFRNKINSKFYWLLMLTISFAVYQYYFKQSIFNLFLVDFLVNIFNYFIFFYHLRLILNKKFIFRSLSTTFLIT